MPSQMERLKLPLAVSAVLGGLSFFTPFSVLSMLGIAVLWALYWPFSRRFDSFVLRLVFGLLFSTCFAQLLGIVFWIAHLSYTVPVVVITQLLLYLLAVSYGGKPHATTWVSRDDIAAGVVSLGSLAVIVAGTVHGGPLVNQALRFVTTGYDNTEHISLTLSLYDHHGYAYGPVEKELNTVLYSNLSSYPQGWALNASLWWHAATPHADIRLHPTKVIMLYMAAVFAWYTLLLYLLVRLMLYLLRLFRATPNDALSYVGVACCVFLAEAIFVVSLLVFGFASFYPALVFSLALVFIVAELLLEPASANSYKRFLAGGLLVAAGVSFSWLLAAPVAYAMLACALLYYAGHSPKKVIGLVRQHKAWSVLAGVLVLGAASQGVVQLLYGVENLINIPGGINPLQPLVVIALLVSTVIGVAYGRSGTPLKALFICVMSGALLIPGAVYLYQYVSSGQATYFSTKAAYIALVLLIVFSGVIIVGFLQDKLLKNTGKLVGVLFVAGFFTFLPIAANMPLGTTDANGIGSVEYAKGVRYLAPESATVIADLLAHHKGNKGNILVYRKINYSEDILTSHFLQQLIRKEIPSCVSDIGSGLTAAWQLDAAKIRNCYGNQDVYIITSSPTNSQLAPLVRGDKHIHLIQV